MDRKPKLMDQVHEAMRARHYSRRTEEAYVQWIKRFIFFHDKRHPASMGGEEVNGFLSWLATDQHVSASTQNQALDALLFLYRHVLDDPLPWLKDVVRAARPSRLPVVMTAGEVRQVLSRMTGPAHLGDPYRTESVAQVAVMDRASPLELMAQQRDGHLRQHRVPCAIPRDDETVCRARRREDLRELPWGRRPACAPAACRLRKRSRAIRGSARSGSMERHCACAQAQRQYDDRAGATGMPDPRQADVPRIRTLIYRPISVGARILR